MAKNVVESLSSAAAFLFLLSFCPKAALRQDFWPGGKGGGRGSPLNATILAFPSESRVLGGKAWRVSASTFTALGPLLSPPPLRAAKWRPTSARDASQHLGQKERTVAFPTIKNSKSLCRDPV